MAKCSDFNQSKSLAKAATPDLRRGDQRALSSGLLEAALSKAVAMTYGGLHRLLACLLLLACLCLPGFNQLENLRYLVELAMYLLRNAAEENIKIKNLG